MLYFYSGIFSEDCTWTFIVEGKNNRRTIFSWSFDLCFLCSIYMYIYGTYCWYIGVNKTKKTCGTKSIFVGKFKIMLIVKKLYFYVISILQFNHLEAWWYTWWYTLYTDRIRQNRNKKNTYTFFEGWIHFIKLCNPIDFGP